MSTLFALSHTTILYNHFEGKSSRIRQQRLLRKYVFLLVFCCFRCSHSHHPTNKHQTNAWSVYNTCIPLSIQSLNFSVQPVFPILAFSLTVKVTMICAFVVVGVIDSYATAHSLALSPSPKRYRCGKINQWTARAI